MNKWIQLPIISKFCMKCNVIVKQALWFYVGKHIKKRILFMRPSRIEQLTTAVANITHILLSAVYQFQRSLVRPVGSTYKVVSPKVGVAYLWVCEVGG